MRTRKRAAAALLAVPALVCSYGCATNPIPPQHPVSQEEAISSGKGAYARVEMGTRQLFMGELIAAADRRLWILTDQGTLRIVPFQDVREVTLGVHDNHADVYALWTVLGSLSTISHGAFLVFTLPLWLVSGISSASLESHRGLFECPSDTPSPPPISMETCLTSTAAFARFPPGLPPGVGVDQLMGRAPAVSPKPAPSPAPPAPPSAPIPPPPPVAPTAPGGAPGRPSA
jgi:hypothetical protein